jgi:hypothetical protein
MCPAFRCTLLTLNILVFAVCKYGAKSLVKARLILLKQSLAALWVKDKLVELFARMVGMQVRCGHGVTGSLGRST